MILSSIHHLTFPIEDPLLKFFIELLIILLVPLLLNKIKIPHLLGLLVAGAVVGPYGFNLLSRDSSVVVTGTTGLLYIMFLAGLEIDMGDFKKNKWKSITFSIYTFLAPFVLGFAGGYYILHFSLLTSILFAALFSSHTLIVYPMISALGIAKNSAVNITVGGTMITDVLTLLVLAVIVGLSQGDVGAAFWLQLSISMIVFVLVVLLIFPIVARWFFKHVSDKISQYIFVVVMIYLASILAELAGIESIIGAFFAGLALNRLIPHTSSLMNRIEFVGNAIFIPFFLISVGMLIDFSAFIKSWETLGVAAIMLLASIGGKYIAAMLIQKTYRLSKDEGRLVFGMSSASAAATLATVMVGYNIILGQTAEGEPIRLLNEHVLNGSILLILISCTISSFVTMSSAQRIAEEARENTVAGDKLPEAHILLPINKQEMTEKMINLGMLIRTKSNNDQLFALNIISEDNNESSVKNAQKILEAAVKLGAAADVEVQAITRHDNGVVGGINNVIKEKSISDLVIGLDKEKGFSTSFMYNLYNGYLKNEHVNLMIYSAIQPISTIKEYVVLVPPLAYQESGFFEVLLKIWNIARNSASSLRFYTTQHTIQILQRVVKKSAIEASFYTITNWTEVDTVIRELKSNQGLIVLMADRNRFSYRSPVHTITQFLNENRIENNYLLIYPYTENDAGTAEKRAVNNHQDFAEIGKLIQKVFR